MLFAINNGVREDTLLDARIRVYPHSQLRYVCHARNVYEIVLEKHSMRIHTPDEAPENDSCYECIRIRQAAATNYQIHCNESRNRIIINFRMRFTQPTLTCNL